MNSDSNIDKKCLMAVLGIWITVGLLFIAGSVSFVQFSMLLTLALLILCVLSLAVYFYSIKQGTSRANFLGIAVLVFACGVLNSRFGHGAAFFYLGVMLLLFRGVDLFFLFRKKPAV